MVGTENASEHSSSATSAAAIRVFDTKSDTKKEQVWTLSQIKGQIRK